MMLMSSVPGTLSCPMPSTLYGVPSILFFPLLRQYSASIEPAGSPARPSDCKSDAGIATGSFDYCSTRLQLPLALGTLDDGKSDPVFHRSAGVEELCFRKDWSANAAGDVIQFDERCPTNRVEDAFVGLAVPFILHQRLLLLRLAGFPRRLFRRGCIDFRRDGIALDDRVTCEWRGIRMPEVHRQKY